MSFDNPPPPQTPNYLHPGQPPRAKTNTLAILALVFSFLIHPLGAIFGHVALAQINSRGEDGRGLAIAGIVVGWTLTAFWLFWIGPLVLALFVGIASVA